MWGHEATEPPNKGLDRGRPECRTAHEPEPEVAEERSELAAEKGHQFRVFDPGGRKVVCVRVLLV